MRLLTGLLFIFVILVNPEMGFSQSIVFTAQSKVDGTVKTPNADSVVEYSGPAKLEQWANAVIVPPMSGSVEVKCTYKFSGKDSSGQQFNMNVSVTKTLAFGDATWSVAGYHVATNAVDTWVYSFKAEKKVAGSWVPLNEGALSVTFKDVSEDEDDENDMENIFQ